MVIVDTVLAFRELLASQTRSAIRGRHRCVPRTLRGRVAFRRWAIPKIRGENADDFDIEVVHLDVPLDRSRVGSRAWQRCNLGTAYALILIGESKR
jgi:hypothetical protein